MIKLRFDEHWRAGAASQLELVTRHWTLDARRGGGGPVRGEWVGNPHALVSACGLPGGWQDDVVLDRKRRACRAVTQ